ncbi:50S ribosomal protein L11 methyltransferase [Oceanicoccus sp. KOV_DT_Chl]|uniref:50S ribosomal protein L11 methyltransferase n=1 Tax=Oceanicoccus sp. KOV_DT_Chl TaxID=1904639 RepID=UPI000C7CEBB6|nr:50S ribosomal protein L11 methyltransferase [Oceanicoccus sp. KOV_DT_Chl]
MSWLQLRVQTTREQTGAVEDALLAAGAVSVTMEDNADQPILEPAVGETPLWNNTRITGLFTADTDTDQATVIATASYSCVYPNQHLPSYRWEILEDKDWEREWMDNFHPMRFGRRLWICPSWKQPPEPNDVNLMLDPGLAFGTGTHPTTALCLEWLDSIDVKGKTVLDYGCGSGILGIAALLLGATQVIAVDNDPQALIATLDNARRNNIASEHIHTYLPEDAPADIQADITVANILAGPLAELAPTISKLTTEHGLLALSGIISSQAEELRQHYLQWFEMDAVVLEQDWARLSGSKR